MSPLGYSIFPNYYPTICFLINPSLFDPPTIVYLQFDGRYVLFIEVNVDIVCMYIYIDIDIDID